MVRSLVFTAGVSSSVTAPIGWGDVLQAALKSPKQGQMLLGRKVFEELPSYKGVKYVVCAVRVADQVSLLLSTNFLLVRAARRWADAALNQPLNPGWLNPSSSNAPAAAEVICLTQEAATAVPRLPKQQINDRFGQHTAHSVALGAAAAIAMALAAAATEEIKKFMYVDFSHADNH
eukprot:gene1586-1927_t